MCSTIIFNADGRKCLAENYDYFLDHGLIGINLRGTRKSNGQSAIDQLVDWVVKYGSITFNQFSLEMPVSGMNEAGLVVALMWHEEGNFGTDSKYLRLSSLQWIQFQLDNYKTIGEVVVGIRSIRPEQGPIPLHYMLLDSHGDSLIVEFIDGELVSYENPNYPILTNTSYVTCLAASNEGQDGVERPLGNSVGRFVHLHRQLSNFNDEGAPDVGFRFLDSVSQSSKDDSREAFPWASYENDTVTAWSIVFDPAQGSVLLKTDRNKTIRELPLNEVDFDAGNDYQVMDINAGTTGSALPFFEPYSKEKNQTILRLTAPAIGFPEEVLQEIVEAVDYLYRERRMS